MRIGILVLCFFGAVWAAAGILLGGVNAGWVAAPVAISAAILFAASHRPASGPSPPHVGRLVGIWSGVEGAAMFVASNVLINLNRRDAIMSVFAMIVGLHFLPLARGIPVRFYYLTGSALVVLGLVALVAPPFHLPLATGLGAAAILWVSAIVLSVRPG